MVGSLPSEKHVFSDLPLGKQKTLYRPCDRNWNKSDPCFELFDCLSSVLAQTRVILDMMDMKCVAALECVLYIYYSKQSRQFLHLRLSYNPIVPCVRNCNKPDPFLELFNCLTSILAQTNVILDVMDMKFGAALECIYYTANKDGNSCTCSLVPIRSSPTLCNSLFSAIHPKNPYGWSTYQKIEQKGTVQFLKYSPHRSCRISASERSQQTFTITTFR